MENIIKGIIPPLLTPLTESRGVDEDALGRLIEHCIQGGVDGIFVLGSCGEGTVLCRKDRRKVVNKAMEVTENRVPLLVGTLETSAERILEEIKETEELGAEYFVAAVPYYLQLSGQDEILKHFMYLAEHIKGKLIVYNIPPYTHADILPETMCRLLEIPNIIAVKDSTGDWALFQKALFSGHKGSILSGNEDLCGPAMIFGADGCVPCLANIYPAFYHDMFSYAQEKNVDKVMQYQRHIVEMKEVFRYGKNWIAVVKYLCARKGLIYPYVGRCLPELSAEERGCIDTYLRNHEAMY